MPFDLYASGRNVSRELGLGDTTLRSTHTQSAMETTRHLGRVCASDAAGYGVLYWPQLTVFASFGHDTAAASSRHAWVIDAEES